jgi:hypothetical protein
MHGHGSINHAREQPTHTARPRKVSTTRGALTRRKALIFGHGHFSQIPTVPVTANRLIPVTPIDTVENQAADRQRVQRLHRVRLMPRRLLQITSAPALERPRVVRTIGRASAHEIAKARGHLCLIQVVAGPGAVAGPGLSVPVYERVYLRHNV